jgi:hypothetical protein
MEEIKMEQQKRQPLTKDCLEGKYVKWEEGESKIVVLGNWGQVKKEFKNKDGSVNETLAIEADVYNIDGKEYVEGEKMISQSSFAFKKAIFPLLENSEHQAIKLRIVNTGKKNAPAFFMEKVQ